MIFLIYISIFKFSDTLKKAEKSCEKIVASQDSHIESDSELSPISKRSKVQRNLKTKKSEEVDLNFDFNFAVPGGIKYSNN